jgi:hypothetical protein
MHHPCKFLFDLNRFNFAIAARNQLRSWFFALVGIFFVMITLSVAILNLYRTPIESIYKINIHQDIQWMGACFGIAIAIPVVYTIILSTDWGKRKQLQLQQKISDFRQKINKFNIIFIIFIIIYIAFYCVLMYKVFSPPTLQYQDIPSIINPEIITNTLLVIAIFTIPWTIIAFGKAYRVLYWQNNCNHPLSFWCNSTEGYLCNCSNFEEDVNMVTSHNKTAQEVLQHASYGTFFIITNLVILAGVSLMSI